MAASSRASRPCFLPAAGAARQGRWRVQRRPGRRRPHRHGLFQGRGAGAEPTSSAVVADLLDLSHASSSAAATGSTGAPKATSPCSGWMCSRRATISACSVTDAPGVLAQIARALGDHGVSIAAVSQKEADADPRHRRTRDHDAPRPRRRHAGRPARDRRAPRGAALSAFLRVEA